MELIIGIDDAGRGPVIGPMILAGVLIQKQDEENLRNLGIKDSKLVIPKKRIELADYIHKNFETHIEITNADEIDSRTKVGTNLNRLEALKAANIIKELLKKTSKNNEQKIRVIIDCPSPNIEAWTGTVKSYLQEEHLNLIKISCEHKADFNHISVGAASIIAKNAREVEIEKLKKEIGIDFGSGYSSDEVTQKFLKDNFKKLEETGIARKSWDTFKKAKAEKEQKKLSLF